MASSGAATSSWLMALAGTILLLALQRSRRFPAALVLLGVGILAGIVLHAGKLNIAGIGPITPQWLHPHWLELRKVLPLLVIPQFALTFGNSVVATENTAQILFGQRAERVTVRALCMSIGILNLITAAIQGAPLCHGSGGITAHHRFGARTPKSSYVIGGLCILLALFGGAAVVFLHLIPMAVLGVFLGYVGVQHAAYLRDILRNPRRLLIAVAVGVISFLTNLMWGFLAGFTLEAIFWTYQRAAKREASA